MDWGRLLLGVGMLLGGIALLAKQPIPPFVLAAWLIIAGAVLLFGLYQARQV